MWDCTTAEEAAKKTTGQIPNNLGEQRYASSNLPSFPIYFCMKSHLNVIPAQGISYVLPPVTNNRPIMDHSLMTGAPYYMLVYTPTGLLSHSYVSCWLFLLFRYRHMYNKIEITKDQKKLLMVHCQVTWSKLHTNCYFLLVLPFPEL